MLAIPAPSQFIRPDAHSADAARHRNAKQAAPGSPAQFRPGQRVLHSGWGLGQVLQGAGGVLTVQFTAGVHEVPEHTLSYVVPVTALARTIATVSQLSAWTVRRAHEEGLIRPDAVGRFAGHRVHYYAVSRIPALIRQLSEADCWRVGTLVLHARCGAGVVSGYGPQRDTQPNSARSSRLVEFFGSPSAVTVSVEDLRCLVPGYLVARRVGASRRCFRRLAAARGIFPDYIAPHGRVREFYDETRLDAICRAWTGGEAADRFSPGCFVLNADGQPGRILSRDACGQMQIKPVKAPAIVERTDVTSVRELVSLRELARRQNFSRYKLSRLLAAAGIKPVHRHGKTLYFDRVRAEQALSVRLSSESNAVPLKTLALQTGISKPVLAKKLRSGCVRSLDHHATHCLPAGEADRVRQVLRTLRSADAIHRLGICRLHSRGRAGHEVVSWDIDALVQTSRKLSPDQQTLVFGQVAWLSEGAGRTRLRAAFDQHLENIESCADRRQIRHTAQCLLTLIDSLSSDFSQYRIRLALLASGAAEDYFILENRIRNLAAQAGCESKQSLQRFRSRLEFALLEVVQQAGRSGGHSACEDESSPGAVLIEVRDGKPHVGSIIAVERQCWNALRRCWHKTIIVRFADGDRRVTLNARLADAEELDCEDPPIILFSRSEVARIAGLIGSPEITDDQVSEVSILQLAS